MADGSFAALQAARDEAWSTPLDQIDVSLSSRFENDTMWPFFERLRAEDPVHYCPNGCPDGVDVGPYWSITRFEDIVDVEVNHEVFSS